MSMLMTIVIAIIIISVILYALKIGAKLFFVLVTIFVLFGMGFVWGPNDLNEKLGLSKYLSNQQYEKVNSFYTDFDQKRSEHKSNVIDDEKVKENYNKAENVIETQSQNFLITIKDKVVEFINSKVGESANQISNNIQNNIELQNQIQK